jgi:3-methyladenine DNA glycosylase AlkD
LTKLAPLQKQLHLLATDAAKASVAKFVPGSQKVYGVKMPFLNEMAKGLKGEEFGLVYELWQAGSFEEKILAAKLINQLAKKNPLEAIKAVRSFSKEIEDWAVCDTLGMQSLKPISKTHTNEIISLAKDLNHSKEFWRRRLSLVLVEVFAKDEKMHPVINSLVKPLEDDKEYYVRKAVAWLKSSMVKKRGKAKSL